MKKIIERFKEIRQEEGGLTLIEALVVIVLIGIMSTVGYVIHGASQTEQGFRDKEMSVNQGPVADKVTELYKAAEDFVGDYPDRELTKQALVNEGYINMPASYTWTVGRYGKVGGEICALAYSTEEQTKKYTLELPAEYSTHNELRGNFATGCWYRDSETKQLLPNWNQIEPFPDLPDAAATPEFETTLTEGG